MVLYVCQFLYTNNALRKSLRILISLYLKLWIGVDLRFECNTRTAVDLIQRIKITNISLLLYMHQLVDLLRVQLMFSETQEPLPIAVNFWFQSNTRTAGKLILRITIIKILLLLNMRLLLDMDKGTTEGFRIPASFTYNYLQQQIHSSNVILEPQWC